MISTTFHRQKIRVKRPIMYDTIILDNCINVGMHLRMRSGELATPC